MQVYYNIYLYLLQQLCYFPFFSSKTIVPYTTLKEVDSNLLKALASHPESCEQINV